MARSLEPDRCHQIVEGLSPKNARLSHEDTGLATPELGKLSQVGTEEGPFLYLNRTCPVAGRASCLQLRIWTHLDEGTRCPTVLPGF